MRTIHDWLPQNHEALYNQSILTWDYLSDVSNRERFGLGASTPLGQWFDNEFTQKYFNFQTTFENWRDPTQRNSIKSAKFQESEMAFKKAYRNLYIGFLKENPLVMEDDLVAMGLPRRQTQRVSAPVAATYPHANIDSSTIRRLIVYFADKGVGRSKAKPTGQTGVEICWAILDTPPIEVNNLVNFTFSTASPFILEFTEKQRGKTVYLCLRWQNTRGEKGPWSEIISAVIP